ncbi:SpoIIE family protein phosphatase [Actinospica robiniae]|uniref:SpoIIE family protein phosphatase n=1 Tax=Actinospica robiniae TaxID=304901 RepID=UPI000684BF0C|nr:SpoIIE family protein phosphatase [Actinospica robiniae]
MDAARNESLQFFLAEIPEQSPFHIVALDTHLRILWVNAAMARTADRPSEKWVGRRLAQMLPGLDSDAVEAMLRHILASGERVVEVEQRGPCFRDSRTHRVWSCSGFRLEEGEDVVGVALIASDVTQRSHDRQRLALLNEASEKIGSTLDITRTAQETLDVLIPHIGDAANISLLSYVLDGGPQPQFEKGDDLRMEIVATRWPTVRELPEAFLRGSVAYLDSASLYYQRLSQDKPIFVAELSETTEEFREMTGSPFFARRLNAAKEAGAHSAMILPITARGAVLGIIAIFRTRHPGFSAQELSLARDVLVRSAICLDNARAYTRERSTALALQRSMLPQNIARTPGVDLVYHYEPANTAAEIGGDWFDVAHQPDGRMALIIGDVTGHDIRAASLMGQLRTVTRTLATLDLSPTEVLTRLDAIVAEMAGEAGATCNYVVLDPESGRCVIARAGHPPPALVRPDGIVEFPDLPAGLPLGVGGAAFESSELLLEPGSILVLYTDGLIESREASIDVGMDRLAHALSAGVVESFGFQFISDLITRLVPDPADDIAVLLARIADDDSTSAAM